MAELLVALDIDACGIIEEALIARLVERLELGDLGAQLRLVVGIIEAGAIGPVER